MSQILSTPLVFISGYATTENISYCLNSTRLFIKLQYVYKITNNNCTKQLIGYSLKPSQRHCRSLRDPTLLDLPLVKTKCGKTLFKFSAASA